MKIFNLKHIQFNQIISDITQHLTQFGLSLNKNTILGQLFTVVAALVHNVYLYIEDAIVEQNKYTAQRKKSLFGLAALTGYEPSYGTASGAWITFMPKVSNYTTHCLIKNKTKLLCTQNNLTYTLLLDKDAIVLNSNQIPVKQFCVQGTFEIQKLIATGIEHEVHNIRFVGFIDTNYITVKINNQIWTIKSGLYDLLPNEQACFIKHNPIEGFDVCFGNSIHGKIPEEGSVIEVEYLIHDGSLGNLTTHLDNVQFVFEDSVSDTSGNELDANALYMLELTNRNAQILGSNPEDIRSVANMIGYNTRSLVLADANSYKEFLSHFPNVGYSRTWLDADSRTVKSLVVRNFKHDLSSPIEYFNILPSQLLLSNEQKTALKNTVKHSGKSLLGVQYEILDPTVVQFAIFLFLKLKNNANPDLDVLNTKIKNCIAQFFIDIQNDNYIPKSDIIQLIKQNCNEIDGVDCQFVYNNLFQKTISTNQNEELFDSFGNIVLTSEDQFPIITGGWNYIADDGAINYVTEAVNILYL